MTGGTNTVTNVLGGTLTGAVTMPGTGSFANGGQWNAIGTSNIGQLTNTGTFNVGGSATLGGLLTNSGVVTVASGGQLIAMVGGITNVAGGAITVAVGGTVRDDLNNQGTVTNNGSYFANVATNTRTITN